jgi:hypothetical protein
MRLRLFLLLVLALVVAVSGWRLRAAGSSQPPAAATCGFTTRIAPPTLVITGPEEITSRVRLVTQPDSPVALSRVDFSEAILNVTDGSFTFEKGYAVEVINLSDRTVTDVRLRSFVRSRNGGAGGGPTVKGPLGPGQSGAHRVSQGRSQGTSPLPSDEVRVLLSVESVEFSDCVYRPSQVLPVYGQPLP